MDDQRTAPPGSCFQRDLALVKVCSLVDIGQSQAVTGGGRVKSLPVIRDLQPHMVLVALQVDDHMLGPGIFYDIFDLFLDDPEQRNFPVLIQRFNRFSVVVQKPEVEWLAILQITLQVGGCSLSDPFA